FAVECAFREKIERFVAGDQKETVGAFEDAPVILPAQIRFDMSHLKKDSFLAERERVFRLIERLALPLAFRRPAADGRNAAAPDQAERQGAQGRPVPIAAGIK